MEKAYITKDSTCCFASLDWACTGPRRCFDGHSTWYLTPSPGHKLLPHCQPWILVSVAETQLGSKATGFSKSASSISEVAQQAGLALGLAGLALGGALGDWTLDRACLSRDKASIWGHPSLFAQRGWPFFDSVGYFWGECTLVAKIRIWCHMRRVPLTRKKCGDLLEVQVP